MSTNDFEYDSPSVDFIFINYKAVYNGKNRDHKIHSEIYICINTSVWEWKYTITWNIGRRRDDNSQHISYL